MKRISFAPRLLLIASLAAALWLSPATAIVDPTPTFTGFSAKAAPPYQSGDESHSHLAVSPGDRPTLEIDVTSHLGIPMTLDLSVTNADTSPRGTIVYSSAPSTASHSLLAMAHIDLAHLPSGSDHATLATTAHTITLAPFATVRVPIGIVVPDEPLVGDVLGGIVLTRSDTLAQSHKNTPHGVGAYSEVVPVHLRGTDETPIPPDFVFQSIKATTMESWPTLTMDIKNQAPLLIMNAELRLRVFASGTTTALIDWIQPGLYMAPMSTLSYVYVLSEDEVLPPNTYVAYLDWTYAGQVTSYEATFALS